MALDVWFQEDIAQSIVSVAVGMLSSASAQGTINVEYCRGVLDTTRAYALAYRILWSAILLEIHGAMSDLGHEEMLDMLVAGAPIVQAET